MPILSLNKNIKCCASKKLRQIYLSREGQVARKLNKTAQCRDPINTYLTSTGKQYPKAVEADLKLLLSEKEVDLLKKCTFINPKNLKEYNILYQHKNPDGTLRVRILNTDGKFIKEADIKPQNVVVLDNFVQKISPMFYNKTEKVPHGTIVKRLIEKSNPFNNYEFMDIHSDGNKMDFVNAIKTLIKRIDNGEKIDIISCSFAREMTYAQLEEITRQQIEHKPMAAQKKIIKETFDRFSKMDNHQLEDYFKNIIEDYSPEFLADVKNFVKMNEEVKLFEQLKKRGVKIFMGAGNERKVVDGKKIETINYNLLADGAEGVGALDRYGTAAEYSGTRKSLFTPHYEKGDICIEYRQNGYNFTGGLGIDIPYSNKAKATYDEICSLSPHSKQIEKPPCGYFYKGIPLNLSMSENTVSPITIIKDGTSWSTPRRVGEYTKYQMLKHFI